MEKDMRQFANLVSIVLLGVVLTGCSLKYDLNPPITSSAEYEMGSGKQHVVYVVDNRQDKTFMKGITGLSKIDLSIGNVADPIAWLAQNLEREFLSHDIPITFTNDESLKSSADITLKVDTYQIINSRASGFHPYVAFHTFSGSIKSTDSTGSVVSYFVYGKVPIWTMAEIQEPCFDMPASILIKGIAAKINRMAFHYQMNDAQLKSLNKTTQDKIDSSAPDAYLSVLELGQSNNPKAIDYLKVFAENEDSLIKSCAISAFGMIGQENTLEFLKGKYSEHVELERFMALKSIGDIGTPEAIQFLKDARKDPQYTSDDSFKFVVDLYLDSVQ